jgi:NAD(P)-dependent dehydrogenase (short-subunit alcohol dehydrogenase family)
MDATTHPPVRRLEGRVIILTGAAGAIGSVYARRLAREGARLALLDLDRERTEAIAAECRAQGAEAIALTTDVSDPDAVRGAVEAVVDRFGGVDCLVNNAAHFATLEHRPFEAIPASELDLLLAVNVRGPFLLCQAVAPHMRRRGGGKIVNIGSGSVLSAPRGLAHYVTSKGAIWAMTRVLARELGPDNITVNTLAPGLTITDAVLANHPADGVVASRQSRSLARDEVPGDLEGTLVYLLSADSDFVSGQMLVVNGGSQLW